MSDYIKREDAIQALHYAVELDNAYEFRKVMIEYIEAIPSADVVEVVRCKDCKLRKKNTFCLRNMWFIRRMLLLE